MNKHTGIYRKKTPQINSVYLKNKTQVGQFQVFVIDLARLWFYGEHSRREVSRNLNIKFGYFNGCRVGLSVNDLFSFIYLFKPMIIFNSPNCAQTTHDEMQIAELIFPASKSDKLNLNTAQNFVPEAETETLVSLAKTVNLSLSGCL